MKELNIAICDDEEIFLKKIIDTTKTIFDKSDFEYRIYECRSGEELIDICQRQNVDAVISDIEMDRINGFEAAGKIKQISPQTKLIFITSYERKVFGSNIYHPFWFARKEYMEELQEGLTELIKYFNEYYNKKILVACGDKEVEIDITKAILISVDGHYVVLENQSGSKRLRGKIDDIFPQIHSRYFSRIQKGLVVNLRFVLKLDSRKVILKDGQTFNIGRSFVADAKHDFQVFKRSEADDEDFF